VLAQVEAPLEAPRASAAAAAVVEARVDAAGAFAVDLHADLDALLLGVSSATGAEERMLRMESLRRGGRAAEDEAIARLVELLRRRLRVRFDGVAADLSIEFPQRRATAGGVLATLGSTVRLRGQAPAGARRLTFFASRSFRGVDLRVEAGGRRSRQILEPGEESAPVELR
jgi:hypothetical protein